MHSLDSFRSPLAEPNDRFGNTVSALKRVGPNVTSYVLVGAPQSNGARGAAYVYTTDAITGAASLVCSLTAPDASPGDTFGLSGTISTTNPSLAIVGAPVVDNKGAIYAVAVCL